MSLVTVEGVKIYLESFFKEKGRRKTLCIFLSAVLANAQLT